MTNNLIQKIFVELQNRGFNIGVKEYLLVHKSICFGFGLESDKKFKNLLVTLLSKSKEERNILENIFEDMVRSEVIPRWIIEKKEEKPFEPKLYPNKGTKRPEETKNEGNTNAVTTKKMPNIPSLKFDLFSDKDNYLILTPKYPLENRSASSSFNNLKIQLSETTINEFDIEETIFERCNKGIFSPVVLKKIKINKPNLILFIDREKSMQPSHSFIDNIVKSISESGRFKTIQKFYFNNLINEYDDSSIYEKIEGLFPKMNKVFKDIKPTSFGWIFKDSDMTNFIELGKLVKTIDNNTILIIISDAGALRSKYNVNRIVTTLSFIKEVSKYTNKYLWLNPLPLNYWHKKVNTANEISKYIPMFSLDEIGLNFAIDTIRKQNFSVGKYIYD